MKRLLILAALAVSLAGPGLAPARAQSNDEGRRLVSLGRSAFEMGNYGVAAQVLWDATLADTAVRDSAPLQTLRARAMMRSGHPENAVRLFDRIGGTPEEYADAMYWRGEALMMMTEPGEAADSFRQALVFNPNHQMAQMRLSSLPAGISTPVAVEAPMIQSAPVDVITTEPTAPARAAPPPAAGAGPTSLRPGGIESGPIATAPIESAPIEAAPLPPPAAPPEPPEPEPEPGAGPGSGQRAEIAPDAAAGPAPAPAAAPDSDLALGQAAFAAGDYAGAAAMLWRATLADEALRANEDVQTMRARAVMLSGRPDTAILVFDRVALSPDADKSAEALYWRGEAEMMLGHEDAAANSFRLALAAQPRHAPARRRLAALQGVPEPAPVIQAAAEPAPAPEMAPEIAPEPEPVAEPEPESVQVAEAAPEPEPEPAPEPAPAAAAPAPLPAAERPAPPLTEMEAAALGARALAGERREARDRSGERRALSDLYLTQLATPEEIERYAELVKGEVSEAPGRDAQIAQLAALGQHYDLSIALYRAVEESGEATGANLAILRTNMATAQLEAGKPRDALRTAEEAIEADESYANAWGVRSLAKRELGDLGGALEDAKYAYDRGVAAPPVLELLNAAGFAITLPQAPPPAPIAAAEIPPPPLRGSAN